MIQAQPVPAAGSGGSVAFVAGSVAAVAIAIGKMIDYVDAKRRDRERDEKLEAALTSISNKVDHSAQSTDARCTAIERSVATLSAHIIGPDGENGMRGDLREVKARLIGLEKRERERLEAAIGIKDRRSGV